MYIESSLPKDRDGVVGVGLKKVLRGLEPLSTIF